MVQGFLLLSNDKSSFVILWQYNSAQWGASLDMCLILMELRTGRSSSFYFLFFSTRMCKKCVLNIFPNSSSYTNDIYIYIYIYLRKAPGCSRYSCCTIPFPNIHYYSKVWCQCYYYYFFFFFMVHYIDQK